MLLPPKPGGREALGAIWFVDVGGRKAHDEVEVVGREVVEGRLLELLEPKPRNSSCRDCVAPAALASSMAAAAADGCPASSSMAASMSSLYCAGAAILAVCCGAEGRLSVLALLVCCCTAESSGRG